MEIIAVEGHVQRNPEMKNSNIITGHTAMEG